MTTLVFFIDRALGNRSVVEALRNAGACVEIHGDHFAANEQDAVWLPQVAQKGWIILTKDQKIAYRNLEQFAIAQSNARVFIFSSGSTSGVTTAEALKNALTKMERFAQGNPSPFIAKVYKSGNVNAWRSRNQLLKILKC